MQLFHRGSTGFTNITVNAGFNTSVFYIRLVKNAIIMHGWIEGIN